MPRAAGSTPDGPRLLHSSLVIIIFLIVFFISPEPPVETRSASPRTGSVAFTDSKSGLPQTRCAGIARLRLGRHIPDALRAPTATQRHPVILAKAGVHCGSVVSGPRSHGVAMGGVASSRVLLRGVVNRKCRAWASPHKLHIFSLSSYSLPSYLPRPVRRGLELVLSVHTSCAVSPGCCVSCARLC